MHNRSHIHTDRYSLQHLSSLNIDRVELQRKHRVTTRKRNLWYANVRNIGNSILENHQTFHNGPTIFIRSSFAALLFLCFFPFLPDLDDLLFWLFEPLPPSPPSPSVLLYLDGLYDGSWEGIFVGVAVKRELDNVGGDEKDFVGLSVELSGVGIEKE